MRPIALWVIPVATVGGVQRHVMDVASVGIPGWRLVVACPEGRLAEDLRAIGVPVVAGPLTPEHGRSAGIRWLRRTITALRPQLVHSHLAYADLLTAVAAIGLDVRVISTEHGIADDDLIYHGTRWRSRLRALAHATRMRRLDALIGVCDSTVAVVRCKWHPPRRLTIATIYNGAAPEPSSRTMAGLRVLSLARLAPEKGLDDLIAAFALLAAEHPDARLTIAGEGPLLESLRRQVDHLGIGAAVEFPGLVDPAAVLPATDVLVQLSVWENCSYSILDALSHHVGVVATPVGGNPELLPGRCLADRSDHRRIAELIATQGLDLSSRPHLPDGWPAINAMVAQISRLYQDGTADRGR